VKSVTHSRRFLGMASFDEAAKRSNNFIPLTEAKFNRLGNPEDIADVVAFVASEKCRWITGHTFQAGGGYV
jgi:NAD(P)-dependent dehydrogenase (short-subunit alcohol dehydrogenase family)